MTVPQPYAAIFFDLDGTLFDLIGCERETVRRLLAQTLPSLHTSEVENFLAAYSAISPGQWAAGLAAAATREEIVEGLFATTFSRLGVDRLTGLAPLYWRLFADVAVLEADAHETLDRLSAHYRLGLITNGYRDTQRPRLAAAGLLHHFERVVVSDEIGWAKPDPRIFAHALAEMGVASSAALYVGDSPSHDLAGALAAGLDFCLYRPKGGEGLALPTGVRLVTALSQLAALLA